MSLTLACESLGDAYYAAIIDGAQKTLNPAPGAGEKDYGGYKFDMDKFFVTSFLNPLNCKSIFDSAFTNETGHLIREHAVFELPEYVRPEEWQGSGVFTQLWGNKGHRLALLRIRQNTKKFEEEQDISGSLSGSQSASVSASISASSSAIIK